jgi:hypothetical protein
MKNNIVILYMNNKYILSTLLVIIILAYIIVFAYSLYSNQQKTTTKYKKNMNYTKLVDPSKIKCIGGNPTKNDNKLYSIYVSYNKLRESNQYLNKNKTNNSPIGPANIFVIRHAERINNVVQLNSNGILRSIFNIDLIEGFNDIGYGIDYIVTVNSDLNSGNMHMQQSVFMVSWMLNIPLFIFGSEKESEIAVSQVYKNVIFNNKNVLFCWEHSCIQQLISNIIKIGPETKKIPNKAFLDKNGVVKLPYWGKNNYQTVIHIDDLFEDHIYSTGIKTCEKNEDLKLEFGRVQTCINVELPLNP